MTKEVGVTFRGSEILSALEAAFLLVELNKPEEIVRDLFEFRASPEPANPLESMFVAAMQDVLRGKIGSGKVKRKFPKNTLRFVKTDMNYLLPLVEIQEGRATRELLAAIGEHERETIPFRKNNSPIGKIRRRNRGKDIGVMLDTLLVEYAKHVRWMANLA